MTDGKNLKKYHEHFKEGDIEGLFGPLENSLNNLAQGPAVKTQDTYDYEYIVKMLLLNQKAHFTLDDNGYSVSFENDKKFNLSEILANFQATHLIIEEKYQQQYLNYLHNDSEMKPEKDPDFTSFGDDSWATEEYFNSRDVDGELKNLSYAEKCAINIYTQDYYTTMNETLRGEITFDSDSSTFQEDMKEVFLHIALASSGLNKVGNTEIKNTFRVDEKLPPELLQQKIDSIKEKTKVISEKGFVSSSKDQPSFGMTGGENPLFQGSDSKSGKVYTVFGNIIGKHISALSNKTKEREILIAPNTQVQYKKVLKEGNSTYLYADIVRTPELNKTPGKAHELTNEESVLKDQNDVQLNNNNHEDIETLIKQVQNLKRDYKKSKWKLYTAPERTEQIAKLMKTANMLAQDKDIPPQEKMIKITEALLNVKNEIHAKSKKKSAFVKLFESESRLEKNINKNLAALSKKNVEIYNTHQSSQNLFDYENPLYGEDMKKIIQHVHDEYLSQPYQDTANINSGEHEFVNSKTNEVVNRPNHATAHTLRGALMVPVVLEYFKKHSNEKEFGKMSIDDIKRMQVAMLFSTVGRQCEDNTKYKKYRDDSALAFKSYCKENCKDLFTEKQIKEYTDYLKWYTDPNKTTKHPKAEIMRICHSLDVLRYEPNEVKFSHYCKKELTYKLGEDPAEALVSYSRQCLIATGNRIRTGENEGKGKEYNPEVFTECSLNPQKALERLQKVAPPKDLSKAKFKL